MDHNVTLTGTYAAHAKPGTPLWLHRAQIIKTVLRCAADKKYPWEVRVAGAKW